MSEMLSLASDRASLTARIFSEHSNIGDSGRPSCVFPPWDNVKQSNITVNSQDG